MKISVIFLLILHSLLSFSSSCPTSTSACSNITNQDTCGSYYVEDSCKENTTTTYCSNCDVCIAGYSDCVKGAYGCKACVFNNGTYTCTGIGCTWGTYCYDGGANITCTKN
jgi:hypothetical protein